MFDNIIIIISLVILIIVLCLILFLHRSIGKMVKDYERPSLLDRTQKWLDSFVEQFVVAPTADAPDFVLQSLPRLESLAMLYIEGAVDKNYIEQRFRGDLRNYVFELQFFLIDHEDTEILLGLPIGNDYPLCRSMVKLDNLSPELIAEIERARRQRQMNTETTPFNP